jgi:hypothetical protein
MDSITTTPPRQPACIDLDQTSVQAPTLRKNATTEAVSETGGATRAKTKIRVYSPLKAIRLNCLDCSERAKDVQWCPCDGIHSTRCHLWPYRFGRRPKTVAERYGPALVTPEMMPSENVSEDDLPNGMEAGTGYLRQANGRISA